MLREVFRGAEHRQQLRAVVAVEHARLGRRAARAQPDVDDAGRWRQLLDRRRIFDGQVRPAEQFGELVAGGEAHAAELRHEDGVRSELADAVAERMVEAADERRHPHDRGDADDDAEDGQRRAQLVGAQRVERDQHDLAAERLSPHARHAVRHSRRSASIGSSRAARDAGYAPKNRPDAGRDADPERRPTTARGAPAAASRPQSPGRQGTRA